jgi:hypothetical protein
MLEKLRDLEDHIMYVPLELPLFTNQVFLCLAIPFFLFWPLPVAVFTNICETVLNT